MYSSNSITKEKERLVKGGFFKNGFGIENEKPKMNIG